MPAGHCGVRPGGGSSQRDGGVEHRMADAANAKKARARRPTAPRADAPASARDRVGEAASAGRHEHAVELATAALRQRGLAAAAKLDLLDLRAESRIALGDVKRAAADADAMLVAGAGAPASPRSSRRRSNRRAFVEIRKGESRLAVVTARRRDRGRAQGRTRAISRRMGLLPARRGAVAPAPQRRGRDSRRCRRAGCSQARRSDGRGPRVVGAVGGAQQPGPRRRSRSRGRRRRSRWRCAAATATARATRRTCSRSTSPTSRSACACCGRRSRRSRPPATSSARASSPTTSRSSTAISGCTRRARRLLLQAADIYRRTGAIGSLAVTLWVLADARDRRGRRSAGVPRLRGRSDRAGGDRRDVRSGSLPAAGLRPAGARGAATTRSRSRSSPKPPTSCAGTTRTALHVSALTLLARAHLGAGDAAGGARRDRAGDRHPPRARPRRRSRAWTARELWWRHSRALAANGKAAAARGRSPRHTGSWSSGIASLCDEGLRRNYLNKVDAHREIVAAWLERRAQAQAGAEAAHRPPRGQDEPARAVRAAGRHRPAPERAAQRRRAARVPDRRGHRALRRRARAAGARVAGRAAARRVAGAARRGRAGAAARTSRPRSHGGAAHARGRASRTRPSGADELDQRSRIVAPLIAQRELLGYLYARHRRRVRAVPRHRPRPARRCSRARPRSRSTTRSGRRGSSRRSRERTEELQRPRTRSSSARTSSRSSTASSRAWPARARLPGHRRPGRRQAARGVPHRRHRHPLVRRDSRADAPRSTSIEHGKRLGTSKRVPRRRRRRGGRSWRRAARASSTRARSRSSARLDRRPGTDQAHSIVVVPIVGGDRVLGS